MKYWTPEQLRSFIREAKAKIAAHEQKSGQAVKNSALAKWALDKVRDATFHAFDFRLGEQTARVEIEGGLRVGLVVGDHTVYTLPLSSTAIYYEALEHRDEIYYIECAASGGWLEDIFEASDLASELLRLRIE